MSKPQTTRQFIERAKAVHGDKYDYSAVNYINKRNKVLIGCRVHGFFMQLPWSHLQGNGCQKCNIDKRRLSTSEFIAKAKAVHGDKYDYGNTRYIKQIIKVDIGCKSCGQTFSQLPNNHLKGNGCPNCATGKPTHTTEMFIEKARKVHGDKYDYSESVYTGIDDPITIRCPVHGPFVQRAADHHQGNGCTVCSRENRVRTTAQFVEEAKAVHGDKYDYSAVEYVNVGEKVEIICKVHGSFFQTANSHLLGHGCSRCSESKGEAFLAKVFDDSNITYIREYRIGDSKKRYDFYLPDYKLLIEFHGGQHYHPIAYFGGIDGHTYTVERDKAKKALAKFYNINLIYFKYTLMRCPPAHFKKLVLKVLEAIKCRKSISWFFKEYSA